jgi:hypothetical protein
VIPFGCQTLSKCHPFSFIFNLGNKTKSQGTKSIKLGDWGMITMSLVTNYDYLSRVREQPWWQYIACSDHFMLCYVLYVILCYLLANTITDPSDVCESSWIVRKQSLCMGSRIFSTFSVILLVLGCPECYRQLTLNRPWNLNAIHKPLFSLKNVLRKAPESFQECW